MPTAFRASNQQAIDTFERFVAPIFLAKFGGSLISTELAPSELLRKFDLNSGIDCFHETREGQTRALALRMQNTGRNHRTFTIRLRRSSGAATELEKRQAAIAKEFEYPQWTIQAYMDGDSLLGFAVVQTRRLLDNDVLDVHGGVKATGYAQIGQSEFIVIEWDCLIAAGLKVLEYDGVYKTWINHQGFQCRHSCENIFPKS